jgi:hypothetical protein
MFVWINKEVQVNLNYTLNVYMGNLSCPGCPCYDFPCLRRPGNFPQSRGWQNRRRSRTIPRVYWLKGGLG